MSREIPRATSREDAENPVFAMPRKRTRTERKPRRPDYGQGNIPARYAEQALRERTGPRRRYSYTSWPAFQATLSNALFLPFRLTCIAPPRAVFRRHGCRFRVFLPEFGGFIFRETPQNAVFVFFGRLHIGGRKRGNGLPAKFSSYGAMWKTPNSGCSSTATGIACRRFRQPAGKPEHHAVKNFLNPGTARLGSFHKVFGTNRCPGCLRKFPATRGLKIRLLSPCLARFPENRKARLKLRFSFLFHCFPSDNRRTTESIKAFQPRYQEVWA